MPRHRERKPPPTRHCPRCHHDYPGAVAEFIKERGYCVLCRARDAKPSDIHYTPEPDVLTFDLDSDAEQRRLAIRAKVDSDNAAGLSTLSSRSRIAQLAESDWFTEQDDAA